MLQPKDAKAGVRAAVDSAQDGADRLQDSGAMEQTARVGFIAYGVVHLLIGWLAVQLAFGKSAENADNQGALHQLAETPVGPALLWLLVVGFVALIAWQLMEAATGHRDEDDDGKRTLKRAASAAKAVVFGGLALSAAKIATGGGSSGGGSSEESATAKLLSQPAGQVLVAIVGLVIIGVGIALIRRGWTEKFTRHLGSSATGQSGRAVVRLGKAGYVAKGASLAVLGVLVITAAVEHDAKKSGGLDDALRSLLDQPFGSVVVAAMGLGFAAYGLFCFARARDLPQS